MGEAPKIHYLNIYTTSIRRPLRLQYSNALFADRYAYSILKFCSSSPVYHHHHHHLYHHYGNNISNSCCCFSSEISIGKVSSGGVLREARVRCPVPAVLQRWVSFHLIKSHHSIELLLFLTCFLLIHPILTRRGVNVNEELAGPGRRGVSDPVGRLVSRHVRALYCVQMIRSC